mgnify:CR=1 FL=1
MFLLRRRTLIFLTRLETDIDYVILVLKDHPMMCVTILNTLKSITVNQDDNMDKYEDQEANPDMSSVELIKEISETFGHSKDELDKSIIKLTDFLDKMIETRHELIEAKRKKADAGKIPMCEFLEEQDHALKALADDEKVKVVKKGKNVIKISQVQKEKC